jgi:hypothetical protein
MGDWVRIVGWSVVSALKSQRDLTLENVALRHQLMVLQRQRSACSTSSWLCPMIGAASCTST